MNRCETRRGTVMSSVRLSVATMAALALVLGLAAGPVSAKTVYDYKYSGTFFEGADSDRGAFPATTGGLAYDRHQQKFFVAVGGTPGYFSKFNSAGAADQFSGLGAGVDSISSGPPGCTSFQCGFGNEPNIAVDQSGGATEGNVFVGASSGASGVFGYKPDGTLLPGWGSFGVGVFVENMCGLTIGVDGDVIAAAGLGLRHYDVSGKNTFNLSAGPPTLEAGKRTQYQEGVDICRPVEDSAGDYTYGTRVDLFDKVIKIDSTTGTEQYEVTQNASSRGVGVDVSNDDVFVLEGLGGTTAGFSVYDENGAKLGGEWGKPEVGYLGLEGSPYAITVDPVTHDVWIANRRDYGAGVRHVEKFTRFNPTVVPTTTVTDVSLDDPNGASATLEGVINPDGIATTDCHFEYGPTQALGSSAPCVEGHVFTGSTDQAVKATVPVTKAQRFFFRLSAKNANERVSLSGPKRFLAQGRPKVPFVGADTVNTDGVRLTGEVDNNGGNTTYHWEWGVGSFESSTPESEDFGFELNTYEPEPRIVSDLISGLTPGTTYQFRAVATNEAGSTPSATFEFTTYIPDPGTDSCPNSLVRQQSGASLLMDCRAYELVSAASTGGYDVESDLIPGQLPLTAYPRAGERLLYSLHQGVVPGSSGNPTNFGRDPYVASRGEGGWSTEYVGLPADGMSQEGPYGSPLLGVGSSLDVFAFGGKDICDPCFADGSTNVPLRLADGSIVKGMAGTFNPAADPALEVAKPFSADGSHFVFGSTAVFEAAGSAEGSIYDRDLDSSTTQVVSTLPNGLTIAGGGLAALDISSEGSRIVVGKKLSTDAAGNDLTHLYMHVGTNPSSVDLTPGAVSGALFAGMTSDGSKVFFTTRDKLVGSDTDAGADLYQAAVGSGGGPASLTRLSVGASPPVGDEDGCDPSANSEGNNWNAVGVASPNDCGVVAIAGGGGVSTETGTIYFLSPEELDGGTHDEPNLFVVKPGSAPHFVATIEPENSAVRNAVHDSEVFRYGDFQVTPNGEFAAFSSAIPLTGYANPGFESIFRYDSNEDELDCASCAPSGALPIGDTSLPDHGLGLSDDGRLFFTSPETFVLRDTNGRADAYEWSDGAIQLISTGTGPEDSSVLTVSADATDVFFFTRDTLVNADENGSTVKVYDARAGGGFLFDPKGLPCAASDECHGPGTEAPPAPKITTVTGSRIFREVQQVKRCRKGFVKRRGKCVKRAKNRSQKKRNASPRHG